MINIVSTPFVKHFGWHNNADSPMDFLCIKFPISAAQVSDIIALTDQIESRHGVSIGNGDEFGLVINDAGLDYMTDTMLNATVAAGGILSGRVCVGVQVSTAALDVPVPNEYESPNRDWPAVAGEEPVRKKVHELMVHLRGENGQSVIFAQEKVDRGMRGLVHEEYLRFAGFFTGYEVFNKATLATWKANNMSGE